MEFTWLNEYNKRGTTMTATNHDGHSNDGYNHDGTDSKPKHAFV